MAVLKVASPKDFYYMYMRYHAVGTGLNAREVAVAAEFLYFRSRYIHTPLKEQEVVFDDNDEEIIVERDMTMLQQLIDKRTLRLITTNLDMSFTVFRKHVQGLTDKKFFGKSDITAKFTPADNHVATFKLQVK